MKNHTTSKLPQLLFLLCFTHVLTVHAHEDHALASSITQQARHVVEVYSKNKTLDQQLVFEFDHPKRTQIDFVPLMRHSDIGVTIGFMKSAPLRATHGLLRELLSDTGYLRAQTIQSLEEVLRNSSPNELTNMRLADAYSLQFFGNPGLEDPFGIKYEGHHISLNFTVANGEVRGTPLFIGSNPAEVQIGLHRGLRALAPQEDYAKALILSLGNQQRSAAINPDIDFVIKRGEQKNPGNPQGIAASDMTEQQRSLLKQAVLSFAMMLRQELAGAELQRMDNAGFENLHFITNGLTGEDEKFHYRIQGPSLLIEFQSMNENHIHCLWRDPGTDFGKDLLSQHLLQDH